MLVFVDYCQFIYFFQQIDFLSLTFAQCSFVIIIQILFEICQPGHFDSISVVRLLNILKKKYSYKNHLIDINNLKTIKPITSA
jgi:hypothetical protein